MLFRFKGRYSHERAVFLKQDYTGDTGIARLNI